jgi:hypothetical protein
MDACDKVAKLLQCGKENSPEAVSGLMQNLENAMTVGKYSFNANSIFTLSTLQQAPVVFPPEKAICPTDYKCIVDVTLRSVIIFDKNFISLNRRSEKRHLTMPQVINHFSYL